MAALTKEEFRQQVLRRDDYDCVHCGRLSVDAHHLLSERLWDDGGHHVDNGVSLCAECRVGALRGDLSPKQLRADADIASALLPPSLDDGFEYDRGGRAVARIRRKHSKHFDPT